jgi:hypothetical protein
LAGSDKVKRPFVLVRLAVGGGPPIERHFLINTAADQTLLTRATFDALGLGPLHLPTPGVSLPGSASQSGIVRVSLGAELIDAIHPPVDIGRTFSAVLDPAALDVNMLGRDVLNGFHLILSFATDTVWLLAGAHGYQVTGP